MSDIVERLRTMFLPSEYFEELCDVRNAKAEILRLRAENEKLRADKLLASTTVNALQEDCEKLQERVYRLHEQLKAQTEHLNLLKSDKGFLQECRNNLSAENEKLNGQAAMNGRLLTENAELREENRLVGLQMDRMADEIEKLRAALKPFAELPAARMALVSGAPDDYSSTEYLSCGILRAAATALKETGDE